MVRFLKSSWVYLLYVSFVFKVFASKLNMKVSISFTVIWLLDYFNTKGLIHHLKSGVRNDQRENENNDWCQFGWIYYHGGSNIVFHIVRILAFINLVGIIIMKTRLLHFCTNRYFKGLDFIHMKTVKSSRRKILSIYKIDFIQFFSSNWTK